MPSTQSHAKATLEALPWHFTPHSDRFTSLKKDRGDHAKLQRIVEIQKIKSMCAQQENPTVRPFFEQHTIKKTAESAVLKFQVSSPSAWPTAMHDAINGLLSASA